MTRTPPGLRSRILRFGVLALLMASAGLGVASCATADDSAGTASPATQLVPTSDAGATADGACDGAGDGCTAPIGPPCAADSFCAVAVPVDGPYALTSVWGSSSADVWAVGSGGTIVHWNGAAWAATPSGTRNTLRAVAGSGPGDVFVASTTDLVLHSSGFDAGTATWVHETPLASTYGFSGAVNSLSVTGPGRVRAAGSVWPVQLDPNSFESTYVHQLLRAPAKPDAGGGDSGSDSGGATVAWAPVPGTATIYGLWTAAEDDVWIVGDNSGFVTWELGFTAHGTRNADGGPLAWQVVESESAVPLLSVWGSSADEVWAVGTKGQIRRIRSGATRWEVVPSPVKTTLRALHGRGPTELWAVGDDATLVRYDGKDWWVVPVELPAGAPRPNLYGVWCGPSGEVWAVGDGIALQRRGAP